jgi:hypothetical protein
MEERILEILKGSIPTYEEVEEIAKVYPSFIVPALRALQATPPPEGEQRQALASRIALAIGNRDALLRILGDDNFDFNDFYPDMKPQTPDTDSTIDSFLSHYGNSSDKETDLLTRMIFSPTPDYGAVLAAEDKRNGSPSAMPADETASRIDQFLGITSQPESKQAVESVAEAEEKVVEETPKAEETPQKRSTVSATSNTRLQESLAGVMIKNGNYQKALEIISQLSLDKPEKITYFADQIRFLKKLLIIQKEQNKNK